MMEYTPITQATEERSYWARELIKISIEDWKDF